MSFTQAYMQLLQKHEERIQTFKKLDLSTLFGEDFKQAETVRDLIYQTEALLDGYDANPDLELYSEDGNESHYLADSTEQSVNRPWEDGLEKSFEQFLTDLCDSNEIPLQFLKDNADEDHLNQLLGCFYYSAANQFKWNFKEEYINLKKEYPNESYYPSAVLDVNPLFYYESSRCW